jgi:uncharacterized membrane protein
MPRITVFLSRLTTGFQALSILSAGLMAGFFFAFSVCVMAGLDLGGGAIAVPAMQGINRAVRNPVFFVAYVGPAVVGAIAALLSFRSGQRSAGWCLAAAAGVYAIGVLLPTSAVNVPMNNALAALGKLSAAEAVAPWQQYSPRWTLWNHLRTGISLVAASLALWGFSQRRSSSGLKPPQNIR